MTDSTDRKVIACLREDASMTTTVLAERIGLSPSAAHRRVKLLEQAGLIQGYRARLSREARGNPSTVYVAVTLKDQRQETLVRFEEALKRCSDVIEAHLMSGESDYLLKIGVLATDSYERVHRDVLARLPGVQRLVSQFSIRPIIDPES